MTGADARALLQRATEARSKGDVEGARAAYLAAFDAARASGDAHLMTEAALAFPGVQRFGVHPGMLPALLHEAYEAAGEPPARCRLAAAVARAWAYGGEPRRAAVFADEANQLAATIDEPALRADALDAALLARWGPDDFAERVSLAARLADVAAHIADPEVVLSALLWRLTTAWECLDIVAIRRQLRALDLLAQESGSPRVAFYAGSRRCMYALAVDDLDAATTLIAETRAAAADVAEPDTEAVCQVLTGERARRQGDADTLRALASAAETYSASEAIPSISALAADWWLAAGEPDNAVRCVIQFAVDDFSAVVRDVDFLLTVACAVRVAAAAGRHELAESGALLLEPYAGRAVINSGAVSFHGVVEEYIYRARAATRAGDSEKWRNAAWASYRRIGATWWERQLEHRPPAARPGTARMVMRPRSSGVWSVGVEGGEFALPDAKGLRLIRYLLQQPGVDIPAVALSDAVAGRSNDSALSDAGELLDRDAVASYRTRLRDIETELDEAAAWSDSVRAERLELERDALLRELRRATGLDGRTRRAGSSAERARVAVRKAIAAAIDRVERNDAQLGRMLRDTVRTGNLCRYDPDPGRPVTWILDDDPVL